MAHDWHKFYPNDVPHEIDLSKSRSIAASFSETVARQGDAPAITCMGATISYNQLERMSDKFAAYLQNGLNLKKGDRIAIMLPNIMQFPIAFLGAQKAGLICVNTNPLYTPREMAHQFKDSGAKAIVILDLFLDKLEEIKSQTAIEHIISTSIADQAPVLKGLVLSALLKALGKVPKHNLEIIKFLDAMSEGARSELCPVDVKLDDIAILQYTGGTTGIAKGAMLSQRNILANMEQIKAWAGDMLGEGDENVLTALPLYHIFALSVNFLAFLSMGSHMFLVPKPIPIKNTVKMFKKYRINVFTGVNTLFNALNHDSNFQKLAPRSIKVALAGGMALQEVVNKEWQRITSTPITEGFGLTEASPVTHCNVLFRENPPGSIGVPLPSTEAKIVDPNGDEVAVGQPGELIIRGPQVMLGYWNRPEDTSSTLRDGWLWTGDIAKRDENGYFYIVDRKKDMILVSGFNVYPNEIEEVLAMHPKVVEAAVIGVEDEKSGEVAKAFVVKKDPSLTEDELKEYCKNQLTNYKRPRYFEFRDELPKTNVGKILRRELRDKA